MASSSMIACLQCKASSSRIDDFKNGWRLRNGEFAKLCHRCACVFEEGIFCETFHLTEDGWRDCEACGKLVHCGCIMSRNAYVILDFGGVICVECSQIKYKLARYRCLAYESRLLLGSQQDLFKLNMIDFLNWPLCTNGELHEILRPCDSVVIPLFEMKLSDADLKLSLLTLPKKCAEAFFPDISEPSGLPMKIRDTEGKDWKLSYHNLIISGCKVYILEGLKELMISKGWQVGDTVIFYKVEPGGRLVIGLRKEPPNED